MKAHILDLEDFKGSQSTYNIASSSIERKRLTQVTLVTENLETITNYEVSIKGEAVLINATLIEAIEMYNSINQVI